MFLNIAGKVTMKLITQFTLFFSLLAVTSVSFANLLITPVRVNFGERDRLKEIIVVNTSDEIRSYNLSWQEQKQTEFGRYQILKGSELEAFNKASDYVRFSPRRITLGPGQNQRVKLMLRRTSNMPRTDFNSHLKFTLIPSTVSAPPTEQESDTDGVSVRMNFFLNYTIPVTIKNHNKVPRLSITDLSFDPTPSGASFGKVRLVVNNLEKTSSYGSFTLYFRANRNEEFRPVGYDNTVNILHEVESMVREIPLVNDTGSTTGEFKVVFEGGDEHRDKLRAEASLVI